MLSFMPPGGVVQCIYRDTSGCSHVRLRWNSQYLSGIESSGITPILLPNPIIDGNWLAGTRAIFWQRPISDQDLNLLTNLKAHQPKFNYKLVGEFDDLCWVSHGEFIPPYNMASLNMQNVEGMQKNVARALSLLDEVVVSTEWLKKSIEDTFDYHAVTVVKNVVPRYLWSWDRKPDKTEDIKVPTVLYSGAPQHYRNPVPKCPQFPNGVEPMPGDWSQPWIDFIIKNVMEHKINFVIMGALPYFFEPIKDMITFIPWVDCNSFPREVMKIKADFMIAPLAENEFNRCKSDLRFLEACATSAVFLGSYWPNSPYEGIHPDCRIPKDASITFIQEKFDALKKKEKWNEVKNWQSEYLNRTGRWLESNNHTNLLLSAFDNTQVGKQFM